MPLTTVTGVGLAVRDAASSFAKAEQVATFGATSTTQALELAGSVSTETADYAGWNIAGFEVQGTMTGETPLPVTALGWTFDPGSLWAEGTPTGNQGDPGSGPATTDIDGTVIGYNLNGGYPKDVPATQYATLDMSIDCSQYATVSLDFYRWLGVEAAPYAQASIQVSTDDIHWTTVWQNPTTAIVDTAWQHETYDITTAAAKQATVWIRFGMGPVNAVVYPGSPNDPGSRNLPEAAISGVNDENHYNPDFTADSVGGPATYYYNFQTIYYGEGTSTALHNQISDVQKERVREIFQLYSNYLGVQFTEVPDDFVPGPTDTLFEIVNGDMRYLTGRYGTTNVYWIPNTGPDGTNAVDGCATPSEGQTGMVIMNDAKDWGNNEFGGHFFTVMMQQIGYLLGLGDATDMPNGTIMGNNHGGLHAGVHARLRLAGRRELPRQPGHRQRSVPVPAGQQRHRSLQVHARPGRHPDRRDHRPAAPKCQFAEHAVDGL